MVKVNISAVIRRKKDLVYQALKELDRFPAFLRDVKEIFIRSLNGNLIISDWKVDIDGTPIEWRQETLLDEESHRIIAFRMIEGDYERYEGKWVLEEQGDETTRVDLHVEFDWGLPVAERFVGGVLEEKARRSVRGMFFALRKELHRK